jgi:hypothetical protein
MGGGMTAQHETMQISRSGSISARSLTGLAASAASSFDKQSLAVHSDVELTRYQGR